MPERREELREVVTLAAVLDRKDPLRDRRDRLGERIADPAFETEPLQSRDSQDDRHCENARHARSGRPRCKAEEARPPAASSTAIAIAAKPKLAFGGTRPSGAPSPSSIKSA